MSTTERKLRALLDTLQEKPRVEIVPDLKRKARIFLNSARKAKERNAAVEALAAKIIALADKHLATRRSKHHG